MDEQGVAAQRGCRDEFAELLEKLSSPIRAI
jgi:hypothetical protein